jgi:hypothetical protein
VSAYLSICSVFRNEAAYLREWVEFHRQQGVERFFLYDNESADGYREALEPYADAGLVELTGWPTWPFQMTAFKDTLRRHRDDSRWIAFLDADEFLFSPTGRPLPEVLREYERWPGIGVNRATYGTSEIQAQPGGLVIESYTRRLSEAHGMSVKSIVDPRRTRRALNPHAFQYADGQAVDENHNELERWHTELPLSFSKLRINHYWLKSEEEFERKYARQRQYPPGPWPGKPDEQRKREANEVLDDILVPYAPAVREALDALDAEAGREA